MAYKIYGGDGDNAMLEVTINGWRVFSMNLSPVKEKDREWLAKHIDNSILVEHRRAAKMAVDGHNKRLRDLIGAANSDGRYP